VFRNSGRGVLRGAEAPRTVSSGIFRRGDHRQPAKVRGWAGGLGGLAGWVGCKYRYRVNAKTHIGVDTGIGPSHTHTHTHTHPFKNVTPCHGRPMGHFIFPRVVFPAHR